MGVTEATGVVKFALVSVGDIGTAQLVAAVTDRRIRVLGLVLTSDVASSFIFSDGDSNLSGEFGLSATTPFICPVNGIGYFQTGVGNALSVILDAGDIKGVLTYQEIL